MDKNKILVLNIDQHLISLLMYLSRIPVIWTYDSNSLGFKLCIMWSWHFISLSSFSPSSWHAVCHPAVNKVLLCRKCFCANKLNASNSQCSGFIHVHKKHANMLTNRISSAVMSCFSQTASCFFNTPLIYSSPVYTPSPLLRAQTEAKLPLRQAHEGPCFYSLSINVCWVTWFSAEVITLNIYLNFLVLHDGSASVDRPDGKMWHHCSVSCSATASNYPINTVYTQAACSPACVEYPPRPILQQLNTAGRDCSALSKGILGNVVWWTTEKIHPAFLLGIYLTLPLKWCPAHSSIGGWCSSWHDDVNRSHAYTF